jgi:CDP-diacylglycerol---glycerol-3-phosphate 3-phosphatidyltransferase
MASIYDLKPKFQQLLDWPTRKLYGAGVTANQVTLAAAVISVALGAALALLLARQASGGAPVGLLWLALPVYLFIRMALNAIDGMLARRYHMQSPLGALLNEAGDVVSDAALYLPFALLRGIAGGWVVTLVLLAALSEMVGVLGQTVGGGRRYDGPLGKSDRAFLFGLIGLLLGLGVPYLAWFTPVMALANALLLLTIWNRGRQALRTARAAQAEAQP